jgi:hypothetical protein
MASLTVFQQSEVVRKKMFPTWAEMNFNVLLDFFKKGEVQKIGERDYRIPIELIPGGDAGTFDPQGGDMGRGSMPQGNVLIQSYFNFRLNYELDKLSIQATTNTGIKNPFTLCVSRGYKEFMLYRDKWCHGDGTAVLATATAHSSSSGVSVYTLTGTGFGAQLLRVGQPVTVYNNGLTTLNTAALRITAINTGATPTVTLNGIVPSAAATDQICFSGVSGTSPAGPRGLAYWISSATSGLTAGLNRATVPQIISKSVNASSSAYAVEHVMGLHDLILNDRAEVAEELMAICAPAQRAAVMKNVVAIQGILLDSTKAQAVDRLPALKDRSAFMWGGVPHMVDIHHTKTTVNFIVPRLWGMATLNDPDFFETDGKTGPDARFIQVYGASGGPAASTWFGLTCGQNPYTIDPGAQGLVSTLSVPDFH